MKQYPAIALIELSSIPAGILCGDAMVKDSPIAILKSGTVHNGKFLILIGGSVASVEQAYKRGLKIGADHLMDSVILPDVHRDVYEKILGARSLFAHDALGIIETRTVATTLKAADSGIKGADVDLVEIRLADDLGGKALILFSGRLEEVEAAIEISKASIHDPDAWLSDTIIPRLDQNMAEQINVSTQFSDVDMKQLEQAEG